MFVLERILRGLSEEPKGKLKLNSHYDELLNKVKELRINNSNITEYHERLRMLVIPYLNHSQAQMTEYLKIYLFAHDNLINWSSSKVDWIGAIKNLLQEKEFALIMRSLRYLRFKGEELILEQISLLLLNTLNKMLNDSNSKQQEISFVLQVTNFLKLKEIDENNLLKLLRSDKVNDRIKAMVIKVVDIECDVVLRMLNKKESAVINAALKEKYIDLKLMDSIRCYSSSKLINLILENYKSFSGTEKAILENRKDITSFDNAYEQYLASLRDVNDMVDPNILRYLLKIDKITCKKFIEKAKNPTSIDYELIAIKTCDQNSFWNSINNLNFMIFPDLEIKPYMLEYVNTENIKSYSVPAQMYFLKLLNGSYDGYESIIKDIYTLYKDNFDFDIKGSKYEDIK